METFKEILQKNVGSIEPAVKPTDTIVEKQEVSEKPEANVTSEVSDEKKKKHSYQAAIDRKHAEAMKYKEEAEKERAEKQELIKRIEALEKPPTAKEKMSLETVEDLQAYLDKVVTKDDMETLIAKILDDRLSKAKETVEKQTHEQTLKSMQNDFSKELYDFYNPDDEVDFVLDDDSRSEAQQMIELFNSKPDFYLEKAKKHGIAYLKKFINGEFESEKKADTLKKIITKADAVKTITETSNNVQPYEATEKPKNMRELFNIGLKSLQKKGA